MPNLNDWLATGLSTLGAFGGVAVVAAGVAKFATDHASKRWLQEHQGELNTALESHKSQLARETETHKLTLKRQELIFQREIDAAQEFMRIWRVIWPQYRIPDMDWYDACTDVAACLGNYEKVLEDYLEDHSIAVSAVVRSKIEAARSAAASEKFLVDGELDNPPKNAVDAAERMLNLLSEAHEEILKDVRR